MVFITQSERISARARDQLRKHGQRARPSGQSPFLTAAGGALLVVIGVLVVLLTATSVLCGSS
ncbi:hypothetical protein C5C41_09060 [Rathayibacter sp. AY1E9]|uniref:hypothetical protein n=1 Tax=Rathayibacter sp. VKM Ac-2762 TaxID=2609254 RepID=UPI000CE78F64|nr:hypothetical protein [Rathayibacter sp. VKM Ac-2762]PPF16752.1 hypothetical protein C5B92_11450 [Rathayibacter sp. AY1A4]PPF35527.1 hypothetical protein C5C10_07640 [Rathayibacter sp. AY1A3]PPF71473.1 hypothetical protein C5C46_10385 [Rathayibacter sp. AY1E6]PPG41167.1 hypothetical protein C5C30_08865 [Rathayibacter sp. AY2B5]PPG52607.1 hypothetical protein C5C41_09060 [Rathayibacter sp. AY1E9]PPG58810.1 hypothetical protein C5C57_09215 [Rathayibacter sp. AY1C5]PPG81605.1 hypothetical pro